MPFDGTSPHPKEAELREAIAVLERAREIVRTRWARTWTQMPIRPSARGFSRLMRRPEPPRHHCAAGAMVIAVHGEDFQYRADMTMMAMAFRVMEWSNPAVIALRDVIRQTTLPRYQSWDNPSVISWNDTHTQHDVIAAFDKAIANLETEIAKGVAYAV